MSIGGEVLSKLVEVLKRQELACNSEAANAQVLAHQASGKAVAYKQIGDLVLTLVEEIEASEVGVNMCPFVPAEREKELATPEKSELEADLEWRKKEGLCTFRGKSPKGGFYWCDNKKTKHTDYCRKHNKELGLTNGKK